MMTPPGWRALWDLGLIRPEFKPKSRADGQTEIFDGDWAASIIGRHSKHRAFLMRQLAMEPGPVRATVMGMTKSHSRSLHGIRIGVAEGFDVDPFREQDHAWSEWWSTAMDDYGHGDWVTLDVGGGGEVVTASGNITIILESRNDYAHDPATAHFDLLQVEDTDVPPVGGVIEELQAIKASALEIVVRIDRIMEEIQ